MGGQSKQESSGDPSVAALNKLLFGEFRGALGQVAGIPGAGAMPSAPAGPPGNRLSDFARAHLDRASGGPPDFGGSALMALTRPRDLALPGFGERNILKQMTGLATSAVPDGLPAGMTAENALAGQTERLIGTMSPAIQRQFEESVAPGVLNTATAAGFTPGSGAVSGSLARAGRDLFLPTAQMAMQMAPTALQLPQQLRAGELGIRGEQLAQMGTGLEAAGAPRLAQLAEESTLRDILLGLFGRPITPSGAQSITQQANPMDQLLGLLGTGAMAFGMRK